MRKEKEHGKRDGKSDKKAVKRSKKSSAKRPQEAPPAESVLGREESAPPADQGSESEGDLRVKEALYLSALSKECQSLKSELDRHIDNHLRALSLVPARGNARQRQLRVLSWSFVSLRKPFPKGLDVLPCALNGSEVYQFTHLIQAVLFVHVKGEKLVEEEQPLAPLVTKTEDVMTSLEARKALYTSLLKLLPELPKEESHERARSENITMKMLYDLLLEIREEVKRR